jgi:8-oxo-dGTP pyrophosphatase MutT (NUDIX family)/phosphohistidine phosphatase SixA
MKLIRAAGGVAWRRGEPAGEVQIAVVHRQRYDDWSLPKGKLEKGEHPLAAAVREVREETGVTGIPHVRLPSTNYLTGEPDTEKSVDFWSMHAESPSTFVTNDEVDELRWVSPRAATELLTYAHDRGVVAAFDELPIVTAVVVVVRHADAGSRQDWADDPATGHDDQRPLDETGRNRADRLVSVLSLFRPVRVYAAPLKRCIDTVAGIGPPVRTDPVFSEEAAAPPSVVADALRVLGTGWGRIVVCSQGGVIPAAIAELHPGNAMATDTYKTAKGSGWVLSFSGDRVVAADALTV